MELRQGLIRLLGTPPQVVAMSSLPLAFGDNPMMILFSYETFI